MTKNKKYNDKNKSNKKIESPLLNKNIETKKTLPKNFRPNDKILLFSSLNRTLKIFFQFP